MSSRLRSFLAIFAAALGCATMLCATMLCAVAQAAPAGAQAAPAGSPAALMPRLHPNQPKIAAYFEAGSYWEFSLLQKEFIKALQQRGVSQQIIFPDEFHVSPG